MSKPSAVIYLNLRRTHQEYGAAIEAAHRLGHAVVLIADSVPAGLPTNVVRAVHKVDTFDPAAVDAAVDSATSEFNVVGVVTWSDPPVETVSRITNRLGLPGPAPEAARIARNKYLMREALAEHPATIPQYARVTTWDELEKAAADIGYPAVLKPTSASGSKGIFIIETEGELRPAFDELIRFTTPERDPVFRNNPNELIFEELLLGTEHSVEGLIHDGHIYIAGVLDKQTSEPFRLETGHIFPSTLHPSSLEAVHDLTRTVIGEVGLNNCAFHLECMVSPEGRAKLVEVAARPGGDFIASHLVGLATGEPFCENVLRVATGHRPELGDGPTMVAGLCKLMAEEDGVFEGLDGLYAALQEPGVRVIVPERAVGATVALPPADYMSSTIGAVIAVAGSDATLRDTLDRTVDALRPRLKPSA